jgi:hypothetical protein
MSLNIAKPQTPTVSKVPKLGPATSRSIFSHPSKGDTWWQTEPSRHFAHRDSKVQKVALLCSDARDAGRVPNPDPQQRWVSSRPSDLRGTRGTRLSRLDVSLIAISNYRNSSFPFTNAESVLEISTWLQPMVTWGEEGAA